MSTTKILVVEDAPDILLCVQKCLLQEGYMVDTANSGEQGLRMALAGEYQAIILDLFLPKVDGYQILDSVREHKRTPVLILTGRDEPDDIAKGLDKGADDYLTKPFNLTELKARVRALIRRNASASDNIEFLDISIDTRRRQLFKEGDVVNLTSKEYSITEYLAKNRGTVVSRDQLYELFLYENTEGFSNILDVYISNIRKKLGRELIRTHRGLGYCIP